MITTDDAIREAERFGFDLSLVRESLLVSYDERARRHEDALVFALELQKAGEKIRAQPQPTTPTSRVE
jgi:CMP-N-acetylneuraminic acid synthetase